MTKPKGTQYISPLKVCEFITLIDYISSYYFSEEKALKTIDISHQTFMEIRLGKLLDRDTAERILKVYGNVKKTEKVEA